jgi:hypothetical protein
MNHFSGHINHIPNSERNKITKLETAAKHIKIAHTKIGI